MIDAPMKSVSGRLVTANKAERAFAREIEAQGKTWIFQPRQFRLSPPLRSYRPDFYVVEDGAFYEVIGTRQAYSFQRLNIEAFKREYPQLRLEIVNKSAYQLTGRTRVQRPKKRDGLTARKTLARLLSCGDGTPARRLGEVMQRVGLARLSDVARATGIAYEKLLYPNGRVVDEVSRLLDSVHV